jgi:hypothetical protein
MNRAYYDGFINGEFNMFIPTLQGYVRTLDGREALVEIYMGEPTSLLQKARETAAMYGRYTRPNEYPGIERMHGQVYTEDYCGALRQGVRPAETGFLDLWACGLS